VQRHYSVEVGEFSGQIKGLAELIIYSASDQTHCQ